jgi:hypothetical protein
MEKLADLHLRQGNLLPRNNVSGVYKATLDTSQNRVEISKKK